MTFGFSTYYSELATLITATDAVTARAQMPDEAQFRAKLADLQENLTQNAPLKVSLIGEFSAGKSSLIGALTGIAVTVDADVCTNETIAYQWRGITLIDTPGIQAQQTETDHDKISRDATIGADLILFVITNELFNPRLARHLRYILDQDGLNLAKKTAIIVNKIDRETNDEATLRIEIQKVLGPHYEVPIYFCAASKYREAETAPAHRRERFITQSRIPALIKALDQFFDDNKLQGRLTTPLQVCADILDKIQANITGSGLDKNRLELLRRQRAVLNHLQNDLLELRKTWKQQAASTVLEQSDPVLDQIDEQTTPDDCENLFALGLKQASITLDSFHDTVHANIAHAMQDAHDQLDAIGDSPLARSIIQAAERNTQAAIAFDGEKPTDDLKMIETSLTIVEKPLAGILSFASQNPDQVRGMVYSIGKTFGAKFRPWQSVHIAKNISSFAGAAGRAIPLLSALTTAYFAWHEHKAEEKKAKYLADLRLSLRNAFADQALIEANILETSIIRLTEGPVGDACAHLDAMVHAIAAANSTKKVIAQEIADLVQSCAALRQSILNGVSQPADSEAEPAA